MSKDDRVPPSLEALAELDKFLSQERLTALSAHSWALQYLQEEDWDDETTVKIVKTPPFTWQNYPLTYSYLISIGLSFIVILIWALKVF